GVPGRDNEHPTMREVLSEFLPFPPAEIAFSLGHMNQVDQTRHSLHFLTVDWADQKNDRPLGTVLPGIRRGVASPGSRAIIRGAMPVLPLAISNDVNPSATRCPRQDAHRAILNLANGFLDVLDAAPPERGCRTLGWPLRRDGSAPAQHGHRE